eukprot:TRINITY_DN12004_c0_g1_i1.p1 TRINITY_DN12004_c0_g1~~TRINITY_DN12004_c0_g1_i1.p1  ORF type:complete len:168 (-),score=23.06 TRINITY_DN12004_c0_g1_i1:33-491(-)
MFEQKICIAGLTRLSNTRNLKKILVKEMAGFPDCDDIEQGTCKEVNNGEILIHYNYQGAAKDNKAFGGFAGEDFAMVIQRKWCGSFKIRDLWYCPRKIGRGVNWISSNNECCCHPIRKHMRNKASINIRNPECNKLGFPFLNYFYSKISIDE